MVHGSIADHTTFDPFVAVLRDDFTTYAIDRRGFEISSDELRGFRSTFQEPSATELTPCEIEPAHFGYDSWRSWAADRWPTSVE